MAWCFFCGECFEWPTGTDLVPTCQGCKAGDDESGYDERVWPIVKRGLEENRMSYRELFIEGIRDEYSKEMGE